MTPLGINFRSALQSVVEQRQRTILSSLGVMVAATAIVLLISIAKGVQADITNQVNDLGVNLLIVLPFRVHEDSMFMPNAAGMSYLKLEDVKRVVKVDGVKQAAPLTFVGGGIRYGAKESPQTLIISAGPEWFRIRPVELAEGHTYLGAEESKPVCVIGSVAKQRLFGDQNAVGSTVLINGTPYRVIGVTQNKSSGQSLFSMGSFENVAYIPYNYFSATTPDAQLHRIMVQTRPEVEPRMLVDNVERAMGERLEKDLFSVVTQKDLLKLVYKLMNILTWLLTGLTSIALFVGGVGIMAVMLMSVGERTKEIGVRKAVGARQRDIFQQFLVESTVVSIIGGLVGLILSYFVCLALTKFTPIKPAITADTVMLCFGVCIGVGIVFGLIPAMSAARKDAVVALRNE